MIEDRGDVVVAESGQEHENRPVDVGLVGHNGSDLVGEHLRGHRGAVSVAKVPNEGSGRQLAGESGRDDAGDIVQVPQDALGMRIPRKLHGGASN